MKTRSSFIAASLIATFAAGASAAYVTGSNPAGDLGIVTSLQSDEGVPQNLVTALKADEGVPQNLVTAMQSDEGVPQNLVIAMQSDEGVPRNLVTA
jgi:hypothetical protein